MIAEMSPAAIASAASCISGRQPVQLQLGVIGAAVDGPFLQDLGDDLPDALAAHGFLGRDLLVARAFAKRAKIRFRRAILPSAPSRRTGAIS